MPATRTIRTVPSHVELTINIRDITHLGRRNSIRERESEELANLDDALVSFYHRSRGRLFLSDNWESRGIVRKVLPRVTMVILEEYS